MPDLVGSDQVDGEHRLSDTLLELQPVALKPVDVDAFLVQTVSLLGHLTRI